MKLWTLVLVHLISLTAVAEPAGMRRGYIESVRNERREVSEEILLTVPEDFEDPSIQERIFDAKITRELQLKYDTEFGYTDVEKNVQSPSRYADLRYDNGVRVTAQEDMDRRQRFGEFMGRKLFEYHLDKYMKTEPSMRPIHDAKEALSNVNVQIGKGYKVNLNYSLSGQTLTLRLDNPKGLTNRLIYEFNNAYYGSEALFFMSYPVTKKVTLSGDYRLERRSWSAIASRRLNAHWNTNVSFLYTPIDVTLPESRLENQYLVGFSWTE